MFPPLNPHPRYFSFRIWQRKIPHNWVVLVIAKHFFGNFRRQILKEKDLSPDEHSTLNFQPYARSRRKCLLLPEPVTLNPNSQLSPFNPQPSTLSPQLSTLNPQTSALNPQPSTLNPQFLTLNPQPYARSHHRFVFLLRLGSGPLPLATPALAAWIRMQGLGFRVRGFQGLGFGSFRVQGLRFRVWSLGFRV